MKLIPSQEFRQFCRGREEWSVCVEAICMYVRDLAMPPEWFEGGEAHTHVERFQYFARLLNQRFDLKFRKTHCHDPLFECLQECGIRDEEVLWWYIWEFLGYRIPRVATCRLYNPDHEKADYPHVAPFDFIRDMFFERVKNSVAFANRTGGKTQNVAILNHLDMAFKPECEVASAGSTLDQAGKVYRYFTGFHKQKCLQDLLVKPPTKTMTLYRNDSMLEVVTGSVKGLNSPHPQKARIDEVELMEWDTLQEGLSMSVSKGKIAGQMAFLCVTGDTLIDIPRNKRIFPKGIPVKDLVGREDLWTYCFSSEKGKFTIGKVGKVWRTKKDVAWRLKYSWEDGGEIFFDEIKATKDHLVMMRDGSYEELQNLKPGDSLMPFNRRLIGSYHQVDVGIKVNPKHPSHSSHWIPEYIYVYGKTSGDWVSRKRAVHHKDFNSFNDEPKNLEALTFPDHTKLHQQYFNRGKMILAPYNREFWGENGDVEKQEIKRKECSQRSKKFWAENYDRMRQVCAEINRRPEVNEKRGKTLKGKLTGEKNPMYRIPYDRHPKGFLGGHHSKKARKKISMGITGWNNRRWKTKERVDCLIDNFDLRGLYETQGYSLSRLIEMTDSTDLVVKKALTKLGIRIRPRSEANKLMWNFVDKESFRQKKRIQAYRQHNNLSKLEELGCVNHKVVSIECLGYEEDMYDIEVEGFGNFVAQGIVLHNSTRKYDTGTFQRLLEESVDTGMTIYCWCIYEVLEKCTRECRGDSEYGDCEIFDKCRGMAHHCSGFYQIRDWIDKAKLLNKDVLDAQWFCKRPSREILVYGEQWDRDVHVKEAGFVPEIEHRIVLSAIDFGSSPGHPFVYSKYWVDYSDVYRAMDQADDPEKELAFKLVFWLFYEYRSAKATMATHAEAIKGSPDYMPGEIIFADPSAKQSRIDLLETYRIDTYGAINAIEEGIDRVKNHLEVWVDYADGGKRKAAYYIIDGYLDTRDELIGTDAEFEKYKYPRQLDGKVVRRIPLKIWDHGMDTCRYVVETSYSVILDVIIPHQDSIEGGFWHP